jgi:hypothetical protein
MTMLSAVAGSRVHFQIWKCGCAKPKKNCRKSRNRGWLMTNVVGAIAWFRVYFPIWKVWLCQKKKKKDFQKIGDKNRKQ